MSRFRMSNDKQKHFDTLRNEEAREIDQMTSKKTTQNKFGTNFDNLFLEELSQFEDGLAVEEIYKNESRVRHEEERKVLEKKKEMERSLRKARDEGTLPNSSRSDIF